MISESYFIESKNTNVLVEHKKFVIYINQTKRFKGIIIEMFGFFYIQTDKRDHKRINLLTF